jgi:hypothetical protein
MSDAMGKRPTEGGACVFADLSPIFKGLDSFYSLDDEPDVGFGEFVLDAVDSPSEEEPVSPFAQPVPIPPRAMLQPRQHSEATDSLLKLLFEKHGPQWRMFREVMIDELGVCMSSDALRNRWIRICEANRHKPVERREYASRVAWTDEEDSLLLHALAAEHSWERVAARVPGRGAHACRNRLSRMREMQGAHHALGQCNSNQS